MTNETASAPCIESCPKFSTCNAPVCPLNEKWRMTRHLPGEAVCLYLREAAKAGGEARARGTLLPDLADPVLSAYREVITSQRTPLDSQAGPPDTADLGRGELRRVLGRSAKSGSKLAAGRRLRPDAPNIACKVESDAVHRAIGTYAPEGAL